MNGNFNGPSSLERRGLPRVKVARYCCPDLIGLEHYRKWVSEALLEEISRLASDLRGVRVCHINSTSSGGGVAEMLSSLTPLCSTLGLTVDWRLIIGDDKFFNATKGFHNALQGARLALTEEARRIYLDHNNKSAKQIGDDYDLYVVHDPQPVAIRQFAAPTHAKWIWRCHIDSSRPEPAVWEFLREFVDLYDGVVFTMQAFQPSDLPRATTWFIPPAIDPLSTKNLELSQDLYQRVLSELGVGLRRPLLLQVSRFDPWKDPLGVVRAYRLVREEVPEVQLALLGGMASDDPQGREVLEALHLEAEGDRGIHIFTNLGNLEVNSFQHAAFAVIQKSTREGFGLVVSEALWKRKPVVAGNVGGIPLQFPAGYEHFLVENVEQCAERLLALLREPAMAQDFGARGRAKVAGEFLLPRLLRDELLLFREVLGIKARKSQPQPSQAPLPAMQSADR